MIINPYVTFNGDCEAAMTFYSEVLGKPLEAMMRFGDMPEEGIPEEMADLVAHVRLALGDGRYLMASDTAEMWSGPYKGIEGAAMQIPCATAEDAHALFAKLSEGGSITMEMHENFWAHAFGMCRDKFGLGWMVNCDKEE